MSLKKKWDEHSIKQTAFNDGKREGIEEGMEKGIEVGMAEGSKQKAREIALELLKMGFPIPQIASTTGLTEQEINAL